MSELLTTEQIEAALQEVPMKMGELPKTATLQDIPLTEGASGPQLKASRGELPGDESERKLKSNSLKRFFRLNLKKKADDGSLEGEKSESNFETANVAPVECSAKQLAASFSKSTLKTSLSSYWNSMFKPKKFGKSSQHEIELDTYVNEASCSNEAEGRLPNRIPDEDALQEIQSLSISDTLQPQH